MILIYVGVLVDFLGVSGWNVVFDEFVVYVVIVMI